MVIEETLERLSQISGGRRTAFIGLGNRERGDDALGLRFVEDLRHLNPNLFLSEEEGVESIILELIENDSVDTVIFVDSCDIGSNPGDAMIVTADGLDPGILSTHKVPLQLLMALLVKEGKSCYLLGMQPKELEYGAGLSEEIVESLRIIENAISAVFKE
ncbi:MAG TPA: hydrogenase maturation protease [Euryarchaeota archaeon]|nr:hydrogenase maturation protease [Euryarchaeota archaeon]